MADIVSSAVLAREIALTDVLVGFDPTTPSIVTGISSDTFEELIAKIPAIEVSTALPDAVDTAKSKQYATSGATDTGLTSAVNVKREGHTSIAILRSDYLGNDREGYARYAYGPRLVESFSSDSHFGGDIVGGDPLGLIAVVVEYTSGVITKVFIEAATDGDGAIADFVTNNPTSNVKLRYRPFGTATWTETLTLDDSSTPRTNVKQWSKDDDLAALSPEPLSMHHHGAGSTSALWEFEILNADDDVALEVAEASFLEGTDHNWIHEQISDNWKRTIDYIAQQLNKTLVDVTGTVPPALNDDNYNALFVDYDIPRIWMGNRERHSETAPSGTFAEWTNAIFEGPMVNDPPASSSNELFLYYNTTNHHWKTVLERVGILQPNSYYWHNTNIEHFGTLNIEWLGERASRAEARLHIQNFNTNKLYLYYNTSNDTVSALDNSTYVAPVNAFNTYRLITIFSPNTGEPIEELINELDDDGDSVSIGRLNAGLGATLTQISLASPASPNIETGDFLQIEDEILRVGTITSQSQFTVIREAFGTEGDSYVQNTEVFLLDIGEGRNLALRTFLWNSISNNNIFDFGRELTDSDDNKFLHVETSWVTNLVRHYDHFSIRIGQFRRMQSHPANGESIHETAGQVISRVNETDLSGSNFSEFVYAHRRLTSNDSSLGIGDAGNDALILSIRTSASDTIALERVQLFAYLENPSAGATIISAGSGGDDDDDDTSEAQAGGGTELEKQVVHDGAAFGLTVHSLNDGVVGTNNANQFVLDPIPKDDFHHGEFIFLFHDSSHGNFHQQVIVTAEMLTLMGPHASIPDSPTAGDYSGTAMVTGRASASADSREPLIVDAQWRFINGRNNANRWTLLIYFDDDTSGDNWQDVRMHATSGNAISLISADLYYHAST